MVDVAVSITDFRRLEAMREAGVAAACWRGLVPGEPAPRLMQIRLGSEFCERLMPTRGQVARAASIADELGLSFALVVANLTDRGIRALRRLLPALPAAAEIVVNDWGTAALMAEERPGPRTVAGRLLCKHLKEARIATPAEDPVAGWPVASAPFREVLRGLGIGRVEVDLAPHTRPPAQRVDGLALSLHVDRGYSAKSHVCKIGSIHAADENKFVPGQRCRRECLHYVTRVAWLPYPETAAPEMFQRGNAWFYRYTPRMTAAAAAALRDAVADRAIVALD